MIELWLLTHKENVEGQISKEKKIILFYCLRTENIYPIYVDTYACHKSYNTRQNTITNCTTLYTYIVKV